MFNIEIMPIKQFYTVTKEADLSSCAAILVTSKEIMPEKLLTVGRILLLEFDDVTGGGSPGAFGAGFASRIKDFVLGLPPMTDTLFVCCDYGESRSPAIAAAIMRRVGLDENSVWQNPKYRPNWFVYGVLCEEFAVPVPDEELAKKIDASEEAFRLAKLKAIDY